MKKYRLKEEALPFFKSKLKNQIGDWKYWENYNVDEKALEEVEDAYVEYGIKNKNGTGHLNGWSEDNGAEFRFTIHFPSMKYKEHDEFSKGEMIRKFMDIIQKDLNYFVQNYNSTKDGSEV